MFDYTNFAIMIPAVLIAVLGVGRLARVLTYDKFPPAIKVRMFWDRVTSDGQWALLAHCFWCASPWIMLICMGWFYVGTLIVGIGIAWWIFWGWLALSYVASMIVARDEPAE